ncbi:hypothetical protein [uncultured Hymenobacter sp.]|uniref:hypothetical protein n=1 Tax=uncultured Hymenobacter sp. TaxID=170016 RepID=UPI0035CC8C7C
MRGNFGHFGLLLASGLALGLTNCTAPGEKQAEQRAAAKANAADAPAPSGAAADKTAPAGLRQLNVFVDISTGMRGFMKPNRPGEPGSQFQQTVTGLLSDVNATPGAQPAYYFVGQPTPQAPGGLMPTTYDELTQTVGVGMKKSATGTEMPEMLRQVLRLHAQKPGTVSVIISDFIYGPQDSRQVFRVKTDVKDALRTAPDPAQLAVSVFANVSEFSDKFFPGNRTAPQLLKGARLPYYIWVLGAPELVRQVDTNLLSRLDGQPQAHFNLHFPTPPHGVVTGYQSQGQWYAEPGPDGGKATGVSFTELSKTAPAQLTVGFDLKNLPLAVQQNFKAPQLQLDATNTDARLLKTWGVGAGPAVPPAGRAYSHFAQVGLSRLPGSKPQTLRFTLAPPMPTWVAGYSTTNDSRIVSQGAKTFLLTEVLTGVRDYFAGQPAANAAVFDVPLTVRHD